MAKSEVIGGDILAKNIVKFGDGFLREVNKDMDRVRKTLSKRIEKNISLSDHSSKDLAALGHPYNINNPHPPHSPEFQVHRQTGELLEGLFSGKDNASLKGGVLTAAAFAGISDRVQHAVYIIFGTSKMIPRDFLRGSLDEVREAIFNTLKRSLNEVTVNFHGEKVKL